MEGMYKIQKIRWHKYPMPLKKYKSNFQMVVRKCKKTIHEDIDEMKASIYGTIVNTINSRGPVRKRDIGN